jgi:hypothetical protein
VTVRVAHHVEDDGGTFPVAAGADEVQGMPEGALKAQPLAGITGGERTKLGRAPVDEIVPFVLGRELEGLTERYADDVSDDTPPKLKSVAGLACRMPAAERVRNCA